MKSCLFACLLIFILVDSTAFAEAPLLFDGKTLDNWTTLDGKPILRGWEVVDGMIHLQPKDRRVGHIVSKWEYGDFRLQFEWRIAAGGNSGLKYRVKQYGGKWRGCEFQILDDAGYFKAMSPRNRAGSLYDMFAPNEKKKLLPLEQFNQSEILVSNDRITHWLNGEKILSVKVGSPEWNQHLAESKFSELKKYAENQRGRIMLTDHGSEVWYRNIKLQLLEAGSK